MQLKSTHRYLAESAWCANSSNNHRNFFEHACVAGNHWKYRNGQCCWCNEASRWSKV